MESVTETKAPRMGKEEDENNKPIRVERQTLENLEHLRKWKHFFDTNGDLEVTQTKRFPHSIASKTFIDFSKQNDVPPSDGVEWKRARRFEPESKLNARLLKFLVFVELRGNFGKHQKRRSSEWKFQFN